jgi:lysophospholipase L1-like esterase
LISSGPHTISTTMLPEPTQPINQTTQVRIVLVGDSTMCNYPSKSPARGWGQFIEERFIEGTVQVINLAVAGRSTKTFISEGDWLKALEENPTFVFIQFGHNDSHAPENPESTDASTTYKELLGRYIDDSRSVGAQPLLVTPMVRRTFDAQGELIDNLLPYANAMKEVAREKEVQFIDLHSSSAVLVEKLGPEASTELANKSDDMTHFNEKGARLMADLVISELALMETRLIEVIKTIK